jgi:uncharacterized membrane protein YhiD involved in acid resistance
VQRNMFRGIFDTELVNTISLFQFILCIGVSLVAGIILYHVYSYKSNSSKSFIATLAMLPAVICIVIMMVNGNIGTGVAVAGAFSLVRFRSVPGTAKEIGAIFIAMGTGITIGMGYLGFGILFVILMSVTYLIYAHLGSKEKRNDLEKTVSITIPEDLNYTNVFDDILKEFTTSYSMEKVKTTNMGSLFKITYNLTLRDATREKEFMDEIRCRNGNLEITISPMQQTFSDL